MQQTPGFSLPILLNRIDIGPLLNKHYEDSGKITFIRPHGSTAFRVDVSSVSSEPQLRLRIYPLGCSLAVYLGAKTEETKEHAEVPRLTPTVTTTNNISAFL